MIFSDIVLFGGIDWEQVMIKGLIGGVVGGIVGLFMYIGKKAQGGDKDEGKSQYKNKRKKKDDNPFDDE
jgi:hypothetical protein